MKPIVFAYILGLLSFSCIDSEEISLESGPVPVGTWSNLEYQSNGFVMERVSKLKENNYGYRFLSNGKLIHRANSGWCGTPPIVTTDYEGTWEKIGDTLKVSSRFWGGMIIQEWKINESSSKTLHIAIVSEEWKMDE